MKKIYAAGSATNIGIEYQQRVSAWFLVSMLTKFNPENYISEIGELGDIDELRFETQNPIDDLVVKFQEKNIYCQIKRSVNLSTSKASDFYRTLSQFVDQYLEGSQSDYFLLATSSKSSSKIVRELRKIISSMRLNDTGFAENPLNKSERSILETYKHVVGKIYKIKSGKDLTDDEFLEFSKRVIIEVFDIEDGSALDKSAVTLLATISDVNPRLIWGSLITNSLSLASKRMSINTDGIFGVIGRYLVKDDKVSREQQEQEYLEAIIQESDLPSGAEYLFVVHETEKFDHMIIGLYRFNDDCSMRIKLSEGKYIHPSGEEFEVLYRASTFTGINRQIEDSEKYKSIKGIAVAVPEKLSEGNESECAKLHADLCLKLMRENKRLLKCLHCAKPISEDNALMVEIEEVGLPHAVGLTHSECLLPLDRILGKIESQLFKDYSDLKRFDFNLWAKSLIKGQGLFASLESAQLQANKRIGWNPDYEHDQFGDYCIKILLSDGSEEYVRLRGVVQRYSLEKSKSERDYFTSIIEDSKLKGDPVGYSSESRMFSKYSVMMMAMGAKEDFLECKSVDVVKYNALIADSHNSTNHYYAPLAYLRVGNNKDALMIKDRLVLISDPLKFNLFKKNWDKINMIDQDYELNIIATDRDFDSMMIRFDNSGFGAVIDPLVDSDGSIINGLLLDNINNLRPQRN